MQFWFMSGKVFPDVTLKLWVMRYGQFLVKYTLGLVLLSSWNVLSLGSEVEGQFSEAISSGWRASNINVDAGNSFSLLEISQGLAEFLFEQNLVG